MTQQQSQNDRPLSQFELLLQSQHQQSQEQRRITRLNRKNKYRQKKKMQQTQMEIEKPINERKRSHPENETSIISIEPKRKQTQDNRLNNFEN